MLNPPTRFSLFENPVFTELQCQVLNWSADIFPAPPLSEVSYLQCTASVEECYRRHIFLNMTPIYASRFARERCATPRFFISTALVPLAAATSEMSHTTETLLSGGKSGLPTSLYVIKTVCTMVLNFLVLSWTSLVYLSSHKFFVSLV